jgi:hypothetical protein
MQDIRFNLLHYLSQGGSHPQEIQAPANDAVIRQGLGQTMHNHGLKSCQDARVPGNNVDYVPALGKKFRPAAEMLRNGIAKKNDSHGFASLLPVDDR